MNTGLINQDNFSDVLRQLSQRRRQGMLELTFADQKVSIAFHTGKIAEVYRGAISPLEELSDWLRSAQVVSPDFSTQGVSTYSQLFPLVTAALLPTARPIDDKAFKSLIRHRTMEKIFSLPLKQGAIFSFAPELVEIDRDFSPSISVGQLLLDMVALESDDEDFEASFSPNAIVSITSKQTSGNLSLDEKYLLELIGGGIDVQTLSNKSLMSSYHFRETLMALFNNKLIAVGAPQTSQPKTSQPASTAMQQGVPISEPQPQAATSPHTTSGAAISASTPATDQARATQSTSYITDERTAPSTPQSYQDSPEHTLPTGGGGDVGMLGALQLGSLSGGSGPVERRIALTPPPLKDAYEQPKPKRNRSLTDVFKRLDFSPDGQLEAPKDQHPPPAIDPHQDESPRPTERRTRKGSGLFSLLGIANTSEETRDHGTAELPPGSHPEESNQSASNRQAGSAPPSSAAELRPVFRDRPGSKVSHGAKVNGTEALLSGRADDSTAQIVTISRRFASSPVVSLVLYWVFFLTAVLVPIMSWRDMLGIFR